ncbi:MAG: redoxin domain-containing protein [Candidatus Zixiibacteriota bacterium]|nr:MAG: redoxin domain-containing protein [candidate division Zixibacteria bacterium]
MSGNQRKEAATRLRCWGILLLALIFVSSLSTCSTKNLLGIAKIGSIFVSSTPPGADIIVDQTLTGKTTPDTVFNVPVGDHAIFVSRPGYLASPDSLVVAVNEDQISTAEFVLLETDHGSLEVTSNVEGATICIDNQPTSEVTPHVFFNSVSVGTHIISIFKEAHSNQEPAKEIVEITTGDTAEVDFTLDPTQVGTEEGDITPDFELQDDFGFWHRFYAYRGFVTIVFFWAEDCFYCMVEMPYIQEIYEEYEADSLIIFGINYGGNFGQEGLEVVRRIREEEQITFTFLVGVETSVKSDYEATSTPLTVILDRGGKIRYRKFGFTPRLPSDIRATLDELYGK